MMDSNAPVVLLFSKFQIKKMKLFQKWKSFLIASFVVIGYGHLCNK